jgi:hypothetical protein
MQQLGCDRRRRRRSTMSYQDRIDAVIALVREHNVAIGQTPDGKPNLGFIDPDKLITCIKASGGITEDRLKAMSYEDILICLPPVETPNGKQPPVIVAKEIAKIFRGKEDPAPADEKRPISGKKADRMTPRELVEAFDPEEPTSSVGKRLSNMSKGKAFIIYESGRKVDTVNTLKVLLEVKSGYPEVAQLKIGNSVKKVYRIGELPNNFADENPLYVGRPLRPDGTCDQTGRSWEGISMEVRQLIRLAMTTGELKIDNIDTAHNVLDLVVRPDAANLIKFRYQKAAVLFDEKPDDRPKLKITLDAVESKESQDNLKGNHSPFDDGRRVVWAPSPDGHYYSARNRE